MAMQVFALLGPVTATPTVSQGQLALTDDAEGQPQSYSEDLATLLASMEHALVQLDSAMQQETVATPSAESGQALVVSMQPQPLFFASSVPTTMPLAESTEVELSQELPGQTGIAADLTHLMPVLPTKQTTEAAEFFSSGWSGTGQQNTAIRLARVFPVVSQPAVPVPVMDPLLKAQHVTSANLTHGLTPIQSELPAAANPVLALAKNNILNLSQTATVAQSIPVTDGTSTVSTLTAGSATATSALPVWQADAMPAQSQHFGQRLLQMLADKVELQLGLNVNKAMIRLDPPSLGSIELSVQLDGDRLTVQMHSSNTQLRDAMGQGLELLRASLQQKLGADVQIELRMGSDSSSQQHQQKTPQQLAQQLESNFHAEPEMALTEATQPNKLNLVNQLV
jgi:flagellar hook-length control protein FliK